MALTTPEGKLIVDLETFLSSAQEQTSAVAEHMHICLRLFDRKQRAYSSANIAVFGDRGILIRLFDKLYRLKTLYENEENPDWETIDDTLRDVCNYAVMALTCRAGQWEGYDPPLQHVLYGRLSSGLCIKYDPERD